MHLVSSQPQLLPWPNCGLVIIFVLYWLKIASRGLFEAQEVEQSIGGSILSSSTHLSTCPWARPWSPSCPPFVLGIWSLMHHSVKLHHQLMLTFYFRMTSSTWRRSGEECVSCGDATSWLIWFFIYCGFAIKLNNPAFCWAYLLPKRPSPIDLLFCFPDKSSFSFM